MSFRISLAALLALGLSAVRADAASCSAFASIKSYDPDTMTVEIELEKGTERKFFPKPEGTPPISKIPNKCRRRVTKQAQFPVKTTGGRMSVTQVRANFSGKMLNDTDDPEWLPAYLGKLAADETTVVVILKPGPNRKDPAKLTTIYLPITEEEKAEIKRLEDQAEDV